jgi:maltoporin
MDLVDPDEGDWRRLGKVTLAPELATGGKFFDRPVLRVFATYARWNREAAENGVILSDAPTPVSDDRDMFTFGVQAEAWW